MNKLDKISFIKDHLKYIDRKKLEEIVYDLIEDLCEKDLDKHLINIIENYYNLDLKEIVGENNE